MKLERYGQRGLEPSASVPAPGEEGIVEDARVLVDDARTRREGDNRDQEESPAWHEHRELKNEK